MAVINVTSADFEKEVLESEKTVLADFWAPWCGPCRMFGPILDEVAAENDSVKVVKINVDEEGDLAARYGVMSIPCAIVFKGGQAVNKSVGAVPKAKVLEMIAE